MGQARLLDLVGTTLQAVIEVFLLCIVGYILARRGIIDDATKKRLNILNVNFFTPCLLFTKVAFTLTPAKLADLYIVPIGFILATIVSYGVAYLLSFPFRLPKSKRNFAMACAMFMNCNSLPVALMQSLVSTVPSLRWGDEDDPEQMLGRALSYLVLCSTLGIILRWSYGVQLLSAADEGHIRLPDEEETSGHRSDDDDDERPLLTNKGKRPRTAPAGAGIGGPANVNGDHGSPVAFKQPGTPNSVHFATVHDARSPTSFSSSDDDGPPELALPGAAQEDPTNAKAGASKRPVPGRKDTKTVFASFPGTPREWRTPAASIKSRPPSSYDLVQRAREANEDDERALAEAARDRDGGAHAGGEGHERTWSSPGRWNANTVGESQGRRNEARRFGRKTWSVVKKTGERIANFMTPPLYAALLSIIVALIPPLQAYLDELTPLRGSLKSAGNCSVPVTLVVLGAYFYTPSPKTAPTKTNVKPGPSYPHPSANGNGNGQSVARDPTDEDQYASLSPEIPHPRSPEVVSPSSSSVTLVDRFKAWRVTRKEAKGKVSPAEKRRKSEEMRTIWVAILARMIISPLVLLPLLALWASNTRNVADDPVFIMVACLVVGSPPAITLAQMTQAVGEAFERLISSTLFFSYAIVTPVTTIALVLFGLVIDRTQDEAGHGLQ